MLLHYFLEKVEKIKFYPWLDDADTSWQVATDMAWLDYWHIDWYKRDK